MYAIIESGGKQYPAYPGKAIRVEKLAGEVGSAIEFGNVLAVSQDDGEMLAGEQVRSANVKGTIAAQARGPKIIVYKFKRRKHYRRKIGHRQDYTEVKIDEIAVGGAAEEQDASAPE